MIQLPPIKDKGCRATGDSMVEATAGGNPLNKRWPSILSGRWPGVLVTNEGVGGETAAQIKDRFLAGVDVNTQICIFWAGRNGVLTLAPAAIVADIQTMINKVGDQRFIVLSVINKKDGTEDTGADADKINALNSLFQSIWPSNYLNVKTALDNASLRVADLLHINAAGNEIVADMVGDFIEQKEWIDF